MPDASGYSLKRTPPTPADAKRLLFRPQPPAPAFPVDALGPLRDAVEAIQMRTQAPMAICAQSVLAAATLAIQAHRNVDLPGAGIKPLTGLFASIADSGERKTSVDRLALAPVYRIEEIWREQRDADLASYLNDRDAWKASRDAALKKHKSDRAAIKTALDEIGPEPKAPPKPMLLVADPTPEALVLHLRDSRPWAGLFTAEGGILLGGSAFSDDSRMRTGALLNVLWDGEPIRRARVLTGDAFLPGRRCSAHIMMQRTLADLLFGDAMLAGIGLLARFLTVAPESTAGTRFFQEAPPECRAILDRYNATLAALLCRQPKMAAGTTDVLDPPAACLSEVARRNWIAFHDAAEKDVAESGELRSIRAFGAKLAEHAGRIAAVLTIYADPEAMEVDDHSMSCGIALAQHYASEMLRLQDVEIVAPDLWEAKKLLAWWQAQNDPRCHLAAIYQRGPASLRDSSTARRVVGILEDHGWVVRLPAGIEIDGQARKEAWELVP